MMLKGLKPIFISLAIFLGGANVVFGAELSQIIGLWEMKHDTDGDPKDHLDFSKSGAVAAIRNDGRRTEGLYRLEGDVVTMIYPLPNGMAYKTSMNLNKKNQLILYSTKTKGMATYERIRP